jgi:hypothetical protein
MTQKFLLLLQSNAAAGREEEFHEWYDNRHVPDLLAVPGIVSAQRYAVSALQPLQPQGHRYVALYEIETDDLARTMATIRERSGTDLMPMSDAMSADRVAFFLEPVGERKTLE